MDGINVRRCPYFFPNRFQKLCYEGGIFESIQLNPLLALQLPFLFMSMFFYAAKTVHSKDIDLIHTHWLVPAGLIGALLSKVTAIPHVMTLHAGGVLGVQRIPLNSIVCNFAYRNTNSFVPVSKYIQSKFEDMVTCREKSSEAKFTIQPMCADASHYEDYDKEQLRDKLGFQQDVVGLFVGNFVTNKGIQYLVDAVERLDVEDNLFQLVMVGTGPLENRITKQVSNSKSANRIELTGFVSKERLNKLYVAADFVVVPSIVDSAGNTEGMPTVISEAFVSRTPVIASDVGGIADVVNDEENGYLVEQKRSDQLAQRMESLIGDPALSERLTKNAKETGKELTWEHCAQTYLRIYRNVNINVEVFDEDEALFPTQ